MTTTINKNLIWNAVVVLIQEKKLKIHLAPPAMLYLNPQLFKHTGLGNTSPVGSTKARCAGQEDIGLIMLYLG